MNYRDIRPDLRQRITDIRDERKGVEDRYRAAVRDLDDREKALQKLLDIESLRFPEEKTFFSGEVYLGSPSEAALEILQAGGALHLDQIKAKAEQMGVPVQGGAYLGRILHGALVSLKREGKVEQVAPSTWALVTNALAPEGTKALFDLSS